MTPAVTSSGPVPAAEAEARAESLARIPPTFAGSS
ncbi:hypothetical protein PPSIR1_18197 [Plesiocystis pacifica SIR-1]|uniref:Uncharacterized protein n=1 Tax=Plesiocystis pacifica SIR-1 TaxID=391625 RepID=A6GBV4_9BACT|nr:hypothetical protein PPSIR1_18197 [Plesiocystis pacifica SIR-1]